MMMVVGLEWRSLPNPVFSGKGMDDAWQNREQEQRPRVEQREPHDGDLQFDLDICKGELCSWPGSKAREM